jgi:hypothetical protein
VAPRWDPEVALHDPVTGLGIGDRGRELTGFEGLQYGGLVLNPEVAVQESPDDVDHPIVEDTGTRGKRTTVRKLACLWGTERLRVQGASE